MKFIINGTSYDVKESVKRVSLHDLYVLKVTEGIGMKTISSDLERIGQLESPMDLLEDEKLMKSFMALIWILRTVAGEKVSLEEANRGFGMGEIEIVKDEDEKAAEEVPKGPTDGPRDGSSQPQ